MKDFIGRQANMDFAIKILRKLANKEKVNALELASATAFLLELYYKQKASPEEDWMEEYEIRLLHALSEYLPLAIKYEEGYN